MGIEKTTSLRGHEKSSKISVPPGFVSLTTFTLKRGENTEDSSSPSIIKNSHEAQLDAMNYTSSSADVSTIEIDRPWILHKLPCSTVNDSLMKPEEDMPLKSSLPKGVIRGCSSCPNCVKVTSGWCPEKSCRPALEEAPAFYPTEEEFKDALKYVSSIRPMAEQFGICRIVPPPSWKLPRNLRRKELWEHSKFKAQIQRIDHLANMLCYRTLDSCPRDVMKKRRKVLKGNSENGPHGGCSMGANRASHNDVGFKSETGSDFTLKDFKKYADDFKSQYFYKKGKATDSSMPSSSNIGQCEPSVENIEGEYWRIVQNPNEEIEVLCGANVDSRELRSGFPVNSDVLEKPEDSEYLESTWNLNNIPKLPGSLLQFENKDISATSVPRISMGMCFSTDCWKLEEHQLYSLSYLHLGSSKLWYGIPARYCYKFEEVVKKHFPQYSKHPELLWKLMSQFPPSMLKSEGIPVYRCTQRPSHFVLTFPGAYHAGFRCGFSCLETVNFAPFDWLPFGYHAVELYREQGRRTSISYDKLLLGAAMAAARAQWELLVMKRELVEKDILWTSICGKDGILTKLFKIRIKQEAARKKYLCSYLQTEKMRSDFDTAKRECWICLSDLYLSAMSCSCSPGVFTCTSHVKLSCQSDSDAKRLLLRYEIDELILLLGVLEGDLKSIKTWGTKKLGSTMGFNGISSDIQATSNGELPASAVAGASLAVYPSIFAEPKETGRQRISVEEEKVEKVKQASPLASSDVIVISDDDDN